MQLALMAMLAVVVASSQNDSLQSEVKAVLPEAQSLYLDLHDHPELSFHETRTAALLADRLRGMGYVVTTLQRT
jgi:hippurate hydrolase